MLLKKLRCSHFKNHSATELSFSDCLNIIVGPNGAGKTTILDGIHYLALASSAFSALDLNNIQYGQNFFVIEGCFVKEERDHVIRYYYAKQARKSLQHNNQPYQRIRDHVGRFPVVLTTPYDIDLIRGGGELRRRFLDTILCQQDNTYLYTLTRYQRLLKQRNQLLRDYKVSGKVDQALLHTYDQQLIPLNQQLALSRFACVKEFLPHFEKYYHYFSGRNEKVSLGYESSALSPDFASIFRSHYQQDLALQRTTQGVHKDDVHFLLNSYPIRHAGSQGQQKSFFIALRLAQFSYLEHKLRYKPILLLDDIFENLDEQRVSRLVKLISKKNFGQLFITDAGHQRATIFNLEEFSDRRVIRMEQGVPS